MQSLAPLQMCIQHFSKRYKRLKTAYSWFLTISMELQVNIYKRLPSFDLEVSFTTNGDTLGVLGASGSGKSMTLRCIAGLEKPDRGRIVLNGRSLFDSDKRLNLPSRERRIGYVFQNYALFPHKSVAQNIAFGLHHLPQAEQKQRVTEQIKLMQLQGLEKRYPHELSGGQQQRVAVARALAIEPEVLLLDEPLSALDTHLRSQIEHQLIQTLTTYKGVTLFVTHNLEEVYRVSQNLLVLSEGKAIAYGSKEDIFKRPTTFTVAQLTGCKNFSRALTISPQRVEATDWGCSVQVVEPMPESLAYVGIRAHQLTFPLNSTLDNTFPCWLATTSETPHRMTLYLKLHKSPLHSQDYDLQAEVFKDQWGLLKNRPFPWYVHLDPLRLFLMQESGTA